MTTATITKITKTGGFVNIDVTFQTGEEQINQTFRTSNGNSDWVYQVIRQRIKEIDETYSFADSISIGPVVLPIVSTASTANQIYAKSVNTLSSLKKLVELGVLDSTDNRILALVSQLRSNFKPEYLSNL